MNERERWVVYPLLFLALGAALRDKLIDQTTTKSIKCQELLVVDEQPSGREVILARIGGVEGNDTSRATSGELLLNGQFTVIDPRGVTKVVSIGRDERKGAPPAGFVAVQGQLVVDGTVNSMGYMFRGLPITPTLRKVTPGVPEFLRTMPQAEAAGGAATSQPTAPSQPAQPEASPADPATAASETETPPANETAPPTE